MEPRRNKQRLSKVKDVEPYDFRRPKLFSKEIMRTLRSLHDIFARSLSRVFSSALRHKVDVSLWDTEQLSMGDYINKIKSPNVLYLLSVEEFSGNVIMVIPPSFCIHMVERQSGGYGTDLSETRSLTIIEEKIINRIVREINREMTVAWEPYMDLTILSTAYESKPENINLGTIDPTIVVGLLIDLGDEQTSIQISYPFSMLKQAMNKSVFIKGKKAEKKKLSDGHFESYQRTLSDTPVCIKPLLGTTKLTVNDIVELGEGDVIPLSQRTDQPLDVKVNNACKMSGYPGVIRGRRAVKIFDMIEEIKEKEVI